MIVHQMFDTKPIANDLYLQAGVLHIKRTIKT